MNAPRSTSPVRASSATVRWILVLAAVELGGFVVYFLRGH